MVSRPTAFDRLLFARAAGGTALLFAIAALLGAVTDEGSVASAVRLERALPILPAAGALGAALVTASSRGRGELRALAASGVAEPRALAYAVVGAVAPSAVAALALLVGVVGAGGFYPRVPVGAPVAWDGTGFRVGASALRVLGDGSLAAVEGEPSAAGGAFELAGASGLDGARAASAALVLSALVLAILGVQRDRPRALAAALATSAALLVAFQGAAAGVVSPRWAAALAGAASIAAGAWWRRESSRPDGAR